MTVHITAVGRATVGKPQIVTEVCLKMTAMSSSYHFSSFLPPNAFIAVVIPTPHAANTARTICKYSVAQQINTLKIKAMKERSCLDQVPVPPSKLQRW